MIAQHRFSWIIPLVTLGPAAPAAAVSVTLNPGSIYFSVEATVDYELAGSYTAIDPLGRRVYLEVQLRDVTNATDLFFNRQGSHATPDESFTLGGAGGDFDNLGSGSVTGTLFPGNEYLFDYSLLIQAYPQPAGDPATATGNVTLTFVPEPASVMLLAVGGIALLLLRSRRIV